MLLRYYLLPTAACLIVLIFTFYAYYRVSKAVNARREKTFEIRTELAQKALESRILEYIQVLKGAQGLYIVTDTVTREMWSGYVRTLEVEKNYPGIQGIGFAVYVDSTGLDHHTSQVRSEGFKDYKVKPEGKRDEYFPIVYLEPFTGRNLRAFGYDMFSESKRRQAMTYARDENAPALTKKVTLVQETSYDVQPGFLLYLPVYKYGKPYNTTEERRKNIEGFVYSPFRSYDLMNTVFEEFNDIDIEIFDSPEIHPEFTLYNKDSVYGTGTAPIDDVLVKDTTMQAVNNQWRLHFTSRPGFGPPSERNLPMVILGGGAVISLLLFFAIAAMANTNTRATELAAEMTKRYRESEEQLRNLFANAPDAVVVIDAQSLVLRWNPKAEQLFGWTAEEVGGRPIYDLIIPLKYREAHKQGMNKYLKTGIGPVLNRTIEVTALKKSGEEFEIELSINAVPGIEPVFISFISDISERKRTEAELIRKTVDLAKSRDLERKKDEFLGVASHELKTPLTSVKAYIQLLERRLEEENCTTVSRQYVAKASSYIDKLNRLISDLLDATKMQAGKLQLNVSEFPIDDFVNEAIEGMQHVSTRHKIIREGNSNAYIEGDKQRLEQVMINLITNAIKYSPNADKVIVSVEELPDRIRIGVRDFGIGITPENQEKIFSRFYRVEKDSSQYSGLGLGLYISSEIIQRHNGDLWVESTVGKGSTFYFTLPLKPVMINSA
jgi:PAS domain S-box-containing protein